MGYFLAYFLVELIEKSFVDDTALGGRTVLFSRWARSEGVGARA
jgi:hypothetical protein